MGQARVSQDQRSTEVINMAEGRTSSEELPAEQSLELQQRYFAMYAEQAKIRNQQGTFLRELMPERLKRALPDNLKEIFGFQEVRPEDIAEEIKLQVQRALDLEQRVGIIATTDQEALAKIRQRPEFAPKTSEQIKVYEEERKYMLQFEKELKENNSSEAAHIYWQRVDQISLQQRDPEIFSLNCEKLLRERLIELVVEEKSKELFKMVEGFHSLEFFTKIFTKTFKEITPYRIQTEKFESALIYYLLKRLLGVFENSPLLSTGPQDFDSSCKIWFEAGIGLKDSEILKKIINNPKVINEIIAKLSEQLALNDLVFIEICEILFDNDLFTLEKFNTTPQLKQPLIESFIISFVAQTSLNEVGERLVRESLRLGLITEDERKASNRQSLIQKYLTEQAKLGRKAHPEIEDYLRRMEAE